jgi:hypothetical protein
VRKAAKGFSVAYTGKGVWGGEIRLVLEPPAGLT